MKPNRLVHNLLINNHVIIVIMIIVNELQLYSNSNDNNS